MIIGTAGHIDHGKSSLVTALTGRKMDRLAEEQRRGITVDLGFAPLELASGELAGIVDVPGHEDLIRTMVAGASGMDLALLVVAADEGIMPQTEEHLLVLEQLGTRLAIPVITKSDLADADWLALVSTELTTRLARSPMRSLSPVAVSVRTGKGIDALREVLNRAAAEVSSVEGPAIRDDLFRLPVDRVLTVPGTGTVVTGTTWSGSVMPGAGVRILPGGETARVRTIESHGRPVPHALPGVRTALGLAGASRSAAGRGSVVVAADSAWRASERIDALIRLAPGTLALTRRTRVLVHHGTAETPAWISVRIPIRGGETGLARVAVERPVIARAGDRFVLRSMSPPRVIGGGEVLDPLPPARADWPEGMAEPDPRARLRALVIRRRRGMPAADLPILTGLPPRAAERAAADDPALERIGDLIVPAALIGHAVVRIGMVVARHHEAHPSEPGMPIATLREKAGGLPEIVKTALVRAVSRGLVSLENGLARAPAFRPRVSGGDAVLRTVIQLVEDSGLTPPTAAELGTKTGRADIAAILRVASGEGFLVPVERDRYFSRRALEEFGRALIDAGKGGDFGVPALRDRLGLSRKYLIPLLEWADRTGLTVRVGDARRLRSPAEAPGPGR